MQNAEYRMRNAEYRMRNAECRIQNAEHRINNVYRQAGHGRRVAQAHYAIDGAFLHRLGPELITAFEQASVAWHRLWGLSSIGSSTVRRRQEAQELSRPARQELSQPARQQLTRPAKRQRIGSADSADRALIGLQRIYHDPSARPRSEGQAAALQLVHNQSPTMPLIVVLPTSSGKSALFFSVAATTNQQTVIVVVPFAALVDDIVVRGRAAGLQCEEWKDERSGHELQQLIVVSADRAVQGEFLHYAQGLALSRQLAHVFFDECHVVLTDTSYRERLRELWKLRYLDCPFTGLTATLMVRLEAVLKERLCMESAQVFRRSSARRTIRYRVVDSKNEPASTVASRLVHELPALQDRQRGVVYVRSYQTGQMMSEALQCPFYKAKAESKGEILQAWIQAGSGWIVATGALGTGINIEGIMYVVHVDRPYGLTSFVQQSGRGGRSGEVSESIIVARVQNSGGWKRKEVLSAYSVEHIDEEAMTAYIQARTCRRQVLSGYFDHDEPADCHRTDSVFCDWCKTKSRTAVVGEPEQEQEGQAQAEQAQAEQARAEQARAEPTRPVGAASIAARLRMVQESYEDMIKVMEQLQGECIYCAMMMNGRWAERLHAYRDCRAAQDEQCGVGQYHQWREDISFGQAKHCWECGLSQRICRRLEAPEKQLACEYAEIMLPGIFILHQRQYLQRVVEAVGFQGTYDGEDLWEWLNGTAEGFGREWESNWMETWKLICQLYMKMAKAEGQAWAGGGL